MSKKNRNRNNNFAAPAKPEEEVAEINPVENTPDEQPKEEIPEVTTEVSVEIAEEPAIAPEEVKEEPAPVAEVKIEIPEAKADEGSIEALVEQVPPAPKPPAVAPTPAPAPAQKAVVIPARQAAFVGQPTRRVGAARRIYPFAR